MHDFDNLISFFRRDLSADRRCRFAAKIFEESSAFELLAFVGEEEALGAEPERERRLEKTRLEAGGSGFCRHCRSKLVPDSPTAAGENPHLQLPS
ncbi:hypothetical protein AAC387_Pa04g1143 [Persea americana]